MIALRLDCRNRGPVRLADFVGFAQPKGDTEVVVTPAQARDLYVELQQMVRFEECATRDDVGRFRPVRPAWRWLLVRPV